MDLQNAHSVITAYFLIEGRRKKMEPITFPHWVSLHEEFVSMRWLGSHWGITHVGKRFLFSHVSYWWFLLNLKKQHSAEGMYSLIRKICTLRLPIQTASLSQPDLEEFTFSCLSMTLMQSNCEFYHHVDQWPCGSIPEASHPTVSRDTTFDTAKTLLNHKIKCWLLLLWIFNLSILSTFRKRD